MNILVTGANGFVGRVLCKKMLADGWRCWVYKLSHKSSWLHSNCVRYVKQVSCLNLKKEP